MAEIDIDAGALLRRARRMARLSQRQLADRARMPPSTVSTIESGQRANPGIGNPGIGTVARLAAVCGLRIDLVTEDGRAVVMHPFEDERNLGGRHFPAHVELVPVNEPYAEAVIGWWGWYRSFAWRSGAPIPRLTFTLARGEYWQPSLDPVSGKPMARTRTLFTWREQREVFRRCQQAFNEWARSELSECQRAGRIFDSSRYPCAQTVARLRQDGGGQKEGL